MRFGERLEIGWSLADETLAARLPSLILQPLVENALRHGIARRTAQGIVEIGARRDGDVLVVWVDDNGPGVATIPHTAEPAEEGGVGLANTRERLARLYPGISSLMLRSLPDGGARAEVRLPFQSGRS